MRKLTHKLQRGQSFHHEGRTTRDGKEFNSNGVVTSIDWEDKVFEVSFAKGEKEEYDFDCLLGCWNEKLGGYWHYVGG